MSDFIQEQVNTLNNNLVALFQNSTFLDQVDKDGLLLIKAIRKLNLTSHVNLHNLHVIQGNLQMFLEKSKRTNTTLEWLFLAKCTIAIYSHILKKLLDSTVPLSESIHYWSAIYGSKTHELYYALQGRLLAILPLKK
jgi:nuclear-control-of-ATPase protein 2